jgi:ribosomal protein S20
MEKDELRARLNDIVKNATAPSTEETPDLPRYSLSTTYPGGVFKASDLYLWLDRLLKISRVKTIRESPTGFVKAAGVSIPVAEARQVSKPTAPTKEEVMAALKKRKAEKTIERPSAPIAIQKPKEMIVSKPSQKPREIPKEAPKEELEIEAPVSKPISKEETEIEAPKEEQEEMEVESKGEIGTQISLEDMKRKDEEETLIRKPSEKAVGSPYIDSHISPRIELPEIITEDIESRSTSDINDISESIGSEVYQDKIEITRRLLELTKLKISEKNLENKKKIDSEIMLLKDRMKAEKKKTTSDLPAMVLGHLSTELDSVIGNLESSIDSSMKELKSKYESAKAGASDDPALLAKIDTQFFKDSNSLAEETSESISRSKTFLIALHSREIDNSVAKGIFTKDKGELEKSKIAKEYPSRFNALISKADQIKQVKQEAVNKSSFSETIKEITNMREAELLHELSARDRKSFLAYIKGELSKTDAIIMAKRSIAKEREVPEDAVNQFFPTGGNK